jgi:DNA-binding transcriptional LysR family regulator
VFCAVQANSSQWIVDSVIARKLDIGLVTDGIHNPYALFEPLMPLPMVCVMPPGNPLADKEVISPRDLDGVAFVGFPPDSNIGNQISAMLESHGVRQEIVVVANWVMTVCEFVAAGVGVSLMHPLFAKEAQDRVTVRPFEPEIFETFRFCRSVESRNADIVDAFAQELRTTATDVLSS